MEIHESSFIAFMYEMKQLLTIEMIFSNIPTNNPTMVVTAPKG